jgi:hypothetical protein
MSNGLTVKISPKARNLAEERVTREGYSSVDDYVDALILDDNFDELSESALAAGKDRRGTEVG